MGVGVACLMACRSSLATSRDLMRLALVGWFSLGSPSSSHVTVFWCSLSTEILIEDQAGEEVSPLHARFKPTRCATKKIMNSTEVQNPRHKLDDECLCFMFIRMCLVLFLPVQSLLTCFRSFLTCFEEFVSSYCNSSSDTKAFLHFIVFSGSPAAVHHPLHARWYYTVGIPFWTACKRQSQTSTFQVKNYDRTWPHEAATQSTSVKPPRVQHASDGLQAGLGV